MAQVNTKSDPILTELHYLFSRSSGKVVAHCLNLDLVASGDTTELAEARLNAVVVAQIASCWTSGNYWQLRFKAPVEYWQALADAKDLPKFKLEVDVPAVVLPVSRSVVSVPVYRHEAQPELVAA